MDKKAVQILHDTYWSPQGWKRHYVTDPVDFEYAKSKRVMFEPARLSHSDIFHWLKFAISKTSKERAARAFLCSLSSGGLYLRSAISSFVIAQGFPDHSVETSFDWCPLCGLYNYAFMPADLNVLNFERLKWGGVRLDNPLYAALDLDLLNREHLSEPTIRDIQIFKDILKVINACPHSDRPNHLVKKLKYVFRSNSATRRNLIEILGICGILQTEQHKGHFPDFIPIFNRTGRPVGRTDWKYPVDWWTGADGVNHQALEFYFGDFIH